MKEKSRSYKYQADLLEIPLDFADLDQTYVNEYMSHFNQYSQRFCNLNDQVADQVIHLALTNLTDKQIEICRLLLKGLNQSEIGRQLNVSQKSVQITIFGCYVYKDGQLIKINGGIINKMKRLIMQDQKIKALLNHMNIVDDIFYIRDVVHIVSPAEPKYKISLNMSYLVSTFFKSDDAFKRWLNNWRTK